MKDILFIAAALAVLALVSASVADAGFCQTTCTGNGNSRTCNTWCY